MRLIYLSDSFYDEFLLCDEILSKRQRPYACLAVKIDGVVFAIPLRHHLSHEYGFRTVGECGLDYSKAVVIRSKNDIGSGRPHINQEEFAAIKVREAMITNGMRSYVKLYKKAKKYRGQQHYKNILAYSSLQYFDEFLS